MESIDKLRDYSHLDDNKWTLETGEIIHVYGSKPDDPNAINWGEQWRKIAEEIEQEIADRYMELPLDAEGVPWHMGDKVRRDQKGRPNIVTGIYLHADGTHKLCVSETACTAWTPYASERSHVKPRTIEDVLRDVWKEALDYAKSDMWRSPDEVLAERVDEIREVLGVKE